MGNICKMKNEKWIKLTARRVTEGQVQGMIYRGLFIFSMVLIQAITL